MANHNLYEHKKIHIANTHLEAAEAPHIDSAKQNRNHLMSLLGMLIAKYLRAWQRHTFWCRPRALHFSDRARDGLRTLDY